MRIRTDQTKAPAEEIFAWQVHQGPVTSLSFAESETLVSGGGDRVIAVTHVPLAGGEPKIQRLKRSLRCSGLRIEGLLPERQRLTLTRMIESTQVSPSIH